MIKATFSRDDILIYQGIELGREEGEMQANIATALRMLAAGFKTEEIAELTGLSLEKVQELVDEKVI